MFSNLHIGEVKEMDGIEWGYTKGRNKLKNKRISIESN